VPMPGQEPTRRGEHDKRVAGTTRTEPPFGSSAIVGPSWRQVWRRGGGEDPWLCDPGFGRVCLCRAPRNAKPALTFPPVPPAPRVLVVIADFRLHRIAGMNCTLGTKQVIRRLDSPLFCVAS
jgi:hypothetical protein